MARKIMPDSPPSRNCDFCNTSTAVIYCRADVAKLCLSCDREVHSTNPLFSKHTRSLLCDICDSSPSSIFCSTHSLILCPNCDWESHSNSQEIHHRRPLEGFTGTPTVNDLMAVFGFEELGKKEGVFGEEEEEDERVESGRVDEFEDYLVWDTPGFVSFDDLIVNSSASDRNFQAMGVPPLPKNRNAALGTYKDELLRQLHELAKSEPNADNSEDMIKPISQFQPLITTPNSRLEGRSSGFQHKLEENVYSSNEANMFQWCPDSCDPGQDFHSDQLIGNSTKENCIVPDETFVNIHSISHTNINHEGESHHTVVENEQVFPAVCVREMNTQERETAISRYKEKKKSRRYDKHIRYESRKVRAENRTRIRGRFAKIDR